MVRPGYHWRELVRPGIHRLAEPARLMLQLIRTVADLPKERVAHEMARLEFKREVDAKDLKDTSELAKDVAAFANSVGGSIAERPRCRRIPQPLRPSPRLLPPVRACP